MYLSTERLALANQEVCETFEQTSIAWQAIPHWDTGDPGQTRVRNDVIDTPDFTALDLEQVPFQVTLVQANAPTPDSLLAEVMAKTVTLAAQVDAVVLQALFDGKDTKWELAGTKEDELLEKLIQARAAVEDAGYRAPSCLITNTKGLTSLSQLVSGYSVRESLLTAANVNSLHRASKIDKATEDGKELILVVGRRQRIAHGSVAGVSCGEEPVDLAVSVLPSLEVLGETKEGAIELAVRIRFATRVKDKKGVVAIVNENP